jgi:hypothetical protein
MDLLQSIKDLVDKSSFAGNAQIDIAINSAETDLNSTPGIYRAASVRRLPQPQLLIFQNNSGSPQAVQDTLISCGEVIWLTQSPQDREIWTRKLVFEDSGIAANFNEKLQSGQFSSYKSIVESFDNSIHRLVALHLANALIYNRVPCGQGINVLEWPQTTGLANGQIPYSILPLLGAYCDSDCWESFPRAFMHHVMGTVRCARKEVAEKLADIVESICS